MVAIGAALALCWSVFAVHVIIIAVLEPIVNRFLAFLAGFLSLFLLFFSNKLGYTLDYTGLVFLWGFCNKK